MRHQLAHFIHRVGARSAQLGDYGALLTRLMPGLLEAGAALGASARLDPLISALANAGGVRVLEKAHRQLLLALAQLV